MRCLVWVYGSIRAGRAAKATGEWPLGLNNTFLALGTLFADDVLPVGIVRGDAVVSQYLWTPCRRHLESVPGPSSGC